MTEHARTASIERRITPKEMTDPLSALNTLPRVTLRSWGFDPDGEFVWWDDPATGDRVITQQAGRDEVDRG